MKLPASLDGIWNGLIEWFSKIHWNRTRAVINGGVYYQLTEAEHDKIRELLKDNYYVILTRRKAHLTTYLIAIASWLVNRRFAHYAHALMNVEGEIEGHIGYKLIEATMSGVHYSTFMQVFNCDSVALLSPKGIPPEEWTAVMEKVKNELGKQYDTLFDIVSDQNVSCVEMIYWGLKTLPDYETRFPKLIKVIEDSKNNLTPQMLYDTGEFDIVYEVRK